MELAPGGIAGQAVTIFVYGALATSILLLAQKNLVPTIYTYAAQTSVVAAVAATVGIATGHLELLFLAAITVVFKVVLVSLLLLRVMRTIRGQREVEGVIGIASSVLLVLLFTGAAFAFTAGIHNPATLSPDALPISLAVVLAGMTIMATRRKAMTQALGLLTAENGAFLAAITLTSGMPLLVEMGVFFDVLTVSIVLGIFVFRINETFADIDTTGLRRLVD
ncbi:MAG TPA: hydrogenase [Candidatus Thermoplasmatota archaeon]|jgi:hydrogenase-4 component E|nr:hydrogenase [Candidatus Thermoplasmatota archaeon]